MKTLLCTLIVVTALLAGCSDQGTVNGPLSARGGTESQFTKPSPLPTFDIDEVFIDPLTNVRYRVFGHIDCAFSNSNGDYTFARRGKFTITDVDQGTTSQFVTNECSKGKASESDPASVSDNYSLGHAFPGVSLSVTYLVSDWVLLEGVAIGTKGDMADTN